MKPVFLGIYITLFLFIGCGGDEDPEISSENNHFYAEWNGEPYTPELAYCSTASNDHRIYAGASRGDFQIGDGIYINLPDTIKAQTYTLTGISNSQKFLSYFASIREGNTQWPAEEGSITITELSKSRIKGTFEFLTSQDTITNGAFDLQKVNY
jgi:hypothetical protein